MRVGELLQKDGLIGPELLAGALALQRSRKLRLCSLLVSLGEVSFDDAARALGSQHGTAAVLQRHLEGRDIALAALMPEALARLLGALPIGTLRDGRLIVGVRDPSVDLEATLSATLRRPLVLAVVPALHLDAALEAAYPGLLLDIETDESAQNDSDDFAIDVELGTDVGMPAPAAPSPPSPPSTPRTVSRPLPVSIKALPRTETGPRRDSLDTAIGSFREIDDREWLFDVAMEYLTTQWSACVLLELRDTRAVGIRGHGKRLKLAVVRSLVLDIADVAVIRLARDEQRIIEVAPDDVGSEHAELAGVIEATAGPIAAPILTGSQVAHVLVLGDPLRADREDALVDLGLLIESMGDALSRM